MRKYKYSRTCKYTDSVGRFISSSLYVLAGQKTISCGICKKRDRNSEGQDRGNGPCVYIWKDEMIRVDSERFVFISADHEACREVYEIAPL
jgi:hypothetical protein